MIVVRMIMMTMMVVIRVKKCSWRNNLDNRRKDRSFVRKFSQDDKSSDTKWKFGIPGDDIKSLLN